MATWKKIIVSGSQAELQGITGSLLTDDKLLFAQNGGAISSTAIDVNAAGHLEGTFSGSFSGSITGNATSADKVNNSLTDGNGITDFTYDGSSPATVSVEISGSTLTVGADGVAVNASGITTTELANGAVTFVKIDGDTVVTAAEGISNSTTGSDDNLATTKAIVDYVNTQVAGANDLKISGSDGSGITIDLSTEDLSFTGTDGAIDTSGTGNAVNFALDTGSAHFTSGVRNKISVADTTGASGIDLSYDASSGEISGSLVNSSITIGNESVDLGGTITTISGLTASGSFSGSFEGDGSGLTGLVSTLTFDGDTGGTSTVDLLSQTFDIAGGTNINTVVSGQQLTVNLDSSITVTDATVNGDLTVLGTASFQHTENLEVADRFIRLASGSSAAGDGGIVVQQSADGTGEVFGFDNPNGRWAVSQSFDGSASEFTAEAFMAAVIEGGAGDTSADVSARYTKKGNIFIQDTGDIFIYS